MKSEVPETAPPNAKALRRIKRLSREDRQRLRTEGVRVTTDGESSVTVHEDMTDLQAQVLIRTDSGGAGYFRDHMQQRAYLFQQKQRRISKERTNEVLIITPPDKPTQARSGSPAPLQPAPPDLSAQSPDEPAYWHSRLRPYVAKGIELCVEMGKLFTEAKEKLGHGKWATFVMGLPQIGFTGGERMARYLMRIARNPALTNRNNYSVLPKSTKALIELSNAQPEAIETAVKTKKIRPTMTADDVLEFINDPVAYDPDSKVPVPFDPDRAEDWLNGQFSKAIERWQKEGGERDQFLVAVKRVINQLE